MAQQYTISLRLAGQKGCLHNAQKKALIEVHCYRFWETPHQAPTKEADDIESTQEISNSQLKIIQGQSPPHRHSNMKTGYLRDTPLRTVDELRCGPPFSGLVSHLYRLNEAKPWD
ncbi:hypothetical protein ACOMHN_001203 [Nucella lapillus]